jgi:hypothetical protein
VIGNEVSGGVGSFESRFLEGEVNTEVSPSSQKGGGERKEEDKEA